MGDEPIQRLRLSPRDGLAAAAIAVIAFALFAPSIEHPFFTFDDPYYVFWNPFVLAGLTLNSIQWAWTTFDQSNWHPLTWLSLELDATLWGPGARGFHASNVALHAANAALVFLALRLLTSRFWCSAAAALLFAVHPLRVESVAWITERKDVLSAFFGLAALCFWARYTAAPSVRAYLPVLLSLTLSLLAKPMLVTFPFLLLVLDWWPLGRVRSAGNWSRLIWEKLPLLLPVVAVAALTLWSQTSYGAVKDLTVYPLWLRVENALVSYVAYLSMTFWPIRLAVYYPHPAAGAGLPAWQVAVAAAILLTITEAALLLRKQAPYLLAGWLWYLGMLVPVSGLIQVGAQALADRYTYLPQVGVLLALCWLAAALSRRLPAAMPAVVIGFGLFLAVRTGFQLALWHDSITLWEHSIRVAGKSPTALISLGRALEDDNRAEEAIVRYREALEIEPKSLLGLTCLGGLLSKTGRPTEAVVPLETARALEPGDALIHSYLGNAYYQLGRLNEAATEEEAAIALAPAMSPAFFTLAATEAARGNSDRAIELYRESIRLAPQSFGPHGELGRLLLAKGELDEAIAELNLALERNPNYAPASAALAQAHWLAGHGLLAKGDARRAMPHLSAAVELDPGSWQANLDTGIAFEARGEPDHAAPYFEKAARLNPRSAEAQFRFGMALARSGIPDEAEKRVDEALRIEPASPHYQQGMARILDARAASLAAEEKLAEAVVAARRALALARNCGNSKLAGQIEEQLHRFERGEAKASKAGPP